MPEIIAISLYVHSRSQNHMQMYCRTCTSRSNVVRCNVTRCIVDDVLSLEVLSPDVLSGYRFCHPLRSPMLANMCYFDPEDLPTLHASIYFNVIRHGYLVNLLVCWEIRAPSELIFQSLQNNWSVCIPNEGYYIEKCGRFQQWVCCAYILGYELLDYPSYS